MNRWQLNLWPVILREMRGQSRQGWNFGLRVLAGLVGAIVMAVVIVSHGGGVQELGPILFRTTNLFLYIFLWFSVPFMACDAVSGEKRNGTLGLLFLTPLRPFEIIFGKSIIHFLRSFTMVLAMFPVVFLAFTFGGITWRESLATAVIQFSTILLALSIGLVASSLTRERHRSLILTGILTPFFAWMHLLLTVLCFGFRTWIQPTAGFQTKYFGWLLLGFIFVTLLGFGAALLRASKQVELFWREGPASSRQFFLTALGVFRLILLGIGVGFGFGLWDMYEYSGSYDSFYEDMLPLFWLIWIMVPAWYLQRFFQHLQGGSKTRVLGSIVFSLVLFWIIGSYLVAKPPAFVLMHVAATWGLSFFICGSLMRLLIARFGEFLHVLIGTVFILPLLLLMLFFIHGFWVSLVFDGWLDIHRVDSLELFLGSQQFEELVQWESAGFTGYLQGLFFVTGLAALFYFWMVPRLEAWVKPRVKLSEENPAGELNKKISKPVAARLLKRRMSRLLDKNPIQWLQQRTWTSRVGKWSWCVLMIFGQMIALEEGFYEMLGFQVIFASLLLVMAAFVASGSFRKEKENGALELLLVTPLKVRMLIQGRMRGLFFQFLPAFLVMFAVFYFSMDLFSTGWRPYGQMDLNKVGPFLFFPIPVLVTFFSISMVGFVFSLHVRNLLLSWILTLLVVGLAPIFALLGAFLFFGLAEFTFGMIRFEATGFAGLGLVWILYQVMLLGVAWRQLLGDFERRKFLFKAA